MATSRLLPANVHFVLRWPLPLVHEATPETICHTFISFPSQEFLFSRTQN